jgi:hypothetical protein
MNTKKKTNSRHLFKRKQHWVEIGLFWCCFLGEFDEKRNFFAQKSVDF